MSRVACVFAVLLVGRVAVAAELPPGAIARLGDDRFRAGSGISHIVVSPDGKQFATIRALDDRGHFHSALTLWDAATGRPIREQELNRELLRGLVWGEGGGRAVFTRIRVVKKSILAGLELEEREVDPSDFTVWDFTDPKAEPPPLVQGIASGANTMIPWLRDGPECDSFQFSGDGSRIAVRWTSADKKKHGAFVYELKPAKSAADLKRVAVIDLGGEGADDVCFSGNGKTVVAFRGLKPANPEAYPDESVATVWDVASGKPQKPVRVPFDYSPMLTPDAREFVIYIRTKTEVGYDLVSLETGKRRQLARRPYSDGDNPADPTGEYFTFSPSGRILIDQRPRCVVLTDLTTGKELGSLNGHTGRTAAAISADGSRIATADGAGLIRLWSAKTLRPLNDVPGHSMAVEYAQLSPDGKRLLTGAPDDTIRLWDLATGKELRAFVRGAGVNTFPGSPTFTPDGTAVLYNSDERLIARDLQTGLEVPLPGEMAKAGARPAVFAPDGKSVLTWDSEYRDMKRINTFDVWDWPSGKKRFAWKTDAIDDYIQPGFSADSAVIFPMPTSPVRIDVSTGRELSPAWKDERHKGKLLYALCALRPPNMLFYLPENKAGEVLEAGTGKSISRFHIGESFGRLPDSLWKRPAALSPNGEQYVWSYGDAHDPPCLYESATRERRRTFDGHRGEVRVLGFTPDGSKLLTAGDDHTVLVWDVRLQSVPLPAALKNETDAAKLWSAMAGGDAKAAYLAMARLAREPAAAVKLVKLKLKSATEKDEKTSVLDTRAIELLESLGANGRPLLKELAEGHAKAFRTQAAKRALERLDAVSEKRP